MVLFLNPERQKYLSAVIAARDHELEREEPREDLLEFVSYALLAEAGGMRIGMLKVEDREVIGCLLQTFANKYQNPVVVRALFQLIVSEMPT